ncbi:MAG: gamma carbonic anhydrase family protein [Planctomycetota bacterium]
MNRSVQFQHQAGDFYTAPSATIVGVVGIGTDANFWFNSVVRGDVAPVTIGARVNVQDGACIHCDSGVPNVIGDDVSIGHGAIVHGERVGPGTLIGMGAVVLGRTSIGAQCLIAAGCTVPPGLQVPDRSVVMGVPGKIVREVRPKELDYLDWLSKHYVDLARRYAAGDFRPPGS